MTFWFAIGPHGPDVSARCQISGLLTRSLLIWRSIVIVVAESWRFVPLSYHSSSPTLECLSASCLYVSDDSTDRRRGAELFVHSQAPAPACRK